MPRLRSPRTWGAVGGAGALGLAAWWLFSVALIATPRAIAALMAQLTDPDGDSEIYDPCCGSGRLLITAHEHARGRGNPSSIAPPRAGDGRGPAPRLYGQEL